MLTEILTLSIVGLILAFAYKKKKIDKSAVILTTIIGFSCLLFGNIYLVMLLLAFFIPGNLVSMYERKRKKEIGCEQKIRTWKNVYGNGMAAMLWSICNFIFPNPIWLYTMYSSLACATADTFATEIGQLSRKKPRLITTLKEVNPGTAGAISLDGIYAAGIGSLLITSPLLLIHHEFWILIFICSIIGSLFDSLLGATAEQRGWINTHDINFLTTMTSGILFFILVFI